jgi:uncharacterized protein YdaU (DUF1376 family)
VNYYPFHIGDYAAATRHLSWDEDAAYRRLLDVYYSSEKPLPSDLRQVCRLVMATTDAQREAVDVVLDEFFILTEEGWTNKRADVEIIASKEKQEQNHTRDEHERERMRRHRERRAELFAGLRAVDVVPAWDTPMKELQRLHDQHCNAPATHLQREQVIAAASPATAIPTPTPTPTPTPKKNPSGSGRGSRLPPEWEPGEDGFAFASAQGLANGRAQAEFEKFRDFWAAKAGQGATKADWQAAWRSWVRKAIEMAPTVRRVGSDEPEWRREKRERVAAFAGPAAARQPSTVIDLEDCDVAPRRLG